MGHVNSGNAHLLLHIPNGASHLDTQLGIQIGQRLIHEKHLGMDDNGPGQGHSLLLAAGQALWQTVLIFVDFYRLQDFIHTLLHVLLWHLADFQAIFHVLADRQMGENGIALEHHADVPFLGRNIVDDLAVKFDAPPFDTVKPGNHAQQSGLAASGWPQEGEEFPIFYKSGQVRYDSHVPIFFHHIVDSN